MTQETIIHKLHAKYHVELTAINETILSYLLQSDVSMIHEIGDYLIKSGGKRLRPILTLISSNLFGYKGSSHITLAATTEFIHAATLLHDDVVDSSLMRRFNPTANSIWGNQAAILVGDYLFSQAFRLMVSTGSMESLKTLADASGIIAKGEVTQLQNIQAHKELDKDEYYKIIEAKTAELFAASCKVGAIIAGCDQNSQDLIYNYGKNIGLIFQIKDDMLDYFSNLSSMGKNIGDDFLEGKITIPIITLMKKADDHDKQIIRQLFFNKEKRDQADLHEIILLLDKYQIQNEVIKLIEYHNKIALDSIEKLNIVSDNADDLKEIIKFASQREC